MKALQLISRKTGVLLLVLLAVLGTFGVGGQAHSAAADSAKSYVYYVSDQVLYRVSTDGSETQKITENYDGNGLESTGKYLYFYYDNAMGIQRLSLSEPDALITSFLGDRNILYYLFDGPYLYFLDDTGHIYRTLSDADDDSQLTLVADNADVNFKTFTVLNGRVYYNALKNNTTNWVASKSRDGSGVIQWIAGGAIPKGRFYHSYGNNINLMIDTIPNEQEYSLNSMVLYSLPLTGGVPKAANAKNPLESNAATGGTWSDHYFLFNKGIKVDAKGEDLDYNTGKGFLMDKNGKIMQLSQNSVISISEIASNKLVYSDSKGKAFISTLANGKITSKALPLSNVKDIRTVKNGTALTTVLFTTTDAYVLNADSTLTKLAGAESDYSVIIDEVPGLYYINGLDNDYLYRYSTDGKTKTKLSTGPVSFIALVSTN